MTPRGRVVRYTVAILCGKTHNGCWTCVSFTSPSMTTLSRAIYLAESILDSLRHQIPSSQTHSFLRDRRHISLIYAISVSHLSSTIITLATQSFYLLCSTGWLMLSPPNIHHNPISRHPRDHY